jgi:hypothetical protein
MTQLKVFLLMSLPVKKAVGSQHLRVSIDEISMRKGFRKFGNCC